MRTLLAYIALAALFQFVNGQTTNQTTTTTKVDRSCKAGCYFDHKITECINSTCTCKNASLIWYPESNKCALPLGSLCSLNHPSSTPCPGFAPCRQPDPAKPATCFNGVNGPCVNETDCSGNSLACFDGKCQCKNGLSLEINSTHRYHCEVKTGSKGCSTDRVTGLKCWDTNAECVLPEGICKCKPGSKLVDRVCQVSFFDKACVRECGWHGNFACKNNKCQCYDEAMVYNNGSQSCEIPVGKRCDFGSPHTGDFKSHGVCAAGSECSADQELGFWICRQRSV